MWFPLKKKFIFTKYISSFLFFPVIYLVTRTSVHHLLSESSFDWYKLLRFIQNTLWYKSPEGYTR